MEYTEEIKETLIKINDFIHANNEINYKIRLLEREVPNLQELVKKLTVTNKHSKKIMNLRFEITMPNNNAWNGVDTGNKGGHFAFRNVDKATADKLDGKSFYYNFGDGWGANVSVTKNRKCPTSGFRGYEWMIEEILKYGEIKNVSERRFNNKLQAAFKVFIKGFIAENGYIKTDPSFQFEKLHSIFNAEMYASKPSV